MHYSQGRIKVIETVVGVFILIIIFFIAAGIFLKQFRYEHDRFILDATLVGPLGIKGSIPEIADFKSLLPVKFKVISKVETYDPKSLYEKINGKADLYLVSGFESMTSQRFASKTDESFWYEFSVYDMGVPKNAFAVFGAQRRMEAKPLGWTRFAYGTDNAFFLARGKYYIEIVGSGNSQSLLEAMDSMVKNFVKQREIAEEQIDELQYFPDTNLVPHSFSLKTANVFGFSEFYNTFTAQYKFDAETLTAFLSKQADRYAAKNLVENYYKFLIDNGAVDMGDGGGFMIGKVVNFYDSIEIVFSNGEYVAGVHEADNELTAKKLAIMLNNKLSNKLSE